MSEWLEDLMGVLGLLSYTVAAGCIVLWLLGFGWL